MKHFISLRLGLIFLSGVIALAGLTGCKKQEDPSSSSPSSVSSSSSGIYIEGDESSMESSDNTTSESSAASGSGQSGNTVSSKSNNTATSSSGNTNTTSSNAGVTLPASFSAGVTAKVSFTGKSANPNFTDEQKRQQKEAGQWLIDQIASAAKDLKQKSFTIPKGNYGFNMTTPVNGIESGTILMNIDRPDNNPFTINAEGVTFWYEQTGKPCASVSRSLYFANCSNITVKGLTIDGYTGNSIEGTLTQIDTSGNRIAIKLSDSSMPLDDYTISRAVKGSECRIVTTKSNGDLMAPLYKVDPSGWGPGALQISDITAKGGGEYWLTFKTKTLLNKITSTEWKNTYGSNGTLETGDGICLLYGVSLLCVDNCKQIKFENLNYYIGKGGFWENGGYGNHTWKDCYFGARPGTNRILGGEGNMSQGLRHGSTYDNLKFDLTTDDAINIHGFWSEVRSVSGNSASFNYAPVGIQAGDKAEFLNSQGRTVATLTVKTTPAASYNYNGFLSGQIEFTSAPPSTAGLKVRWPASECDGWKIINCTFNNIYQRILINSGSGTFENNTVLNTGSSLSLFSNGSGGYEGGVMKNITIRNNVFYNTANHPAGTAIELYQSPNYHTFIKAENITISNNAFVNCGMLFTSNNFKNLTFSNNTVINPIAYGKTITALDQLYSLANTEGFTQSGNLLKTNSSNLQKIISTCRDTSKAAKDKVTSIRSMA